MDNLAPPGLPPLQLFFLKEFKKDRIRKYYCSQIILMAATKIKVNLYKYFFKTSRALSTILLKEHLQELTKLVLIFLSFFKFTQLEVFF